LLRNNGDLHFAFLDVEDLIGRVSLRKDDLALAVRAKTPALADHGEKRLRIERRSAFGCHHTTSVPRDAAAQAFEYPN
jgi:hypothetical protein